MLDQFGVLPYNEDVQGWTAFFKTGKVLLGLNNKGEGTTSDRLKGIELALGNVLPNRHQLLCTKHMEQNLLNLGKATKEQAKRISDLAYSRSSHAFDSNKAAALQGLKPVTQSYVPVCLSCFC